MRIYKVKQPSFSNYSVEETFYNEDGEDMGKCIRNDYTIEGYFKYVIYHGYLLNDNYVKKWVYKEFDNEYYL